VAWYRKQTDDGVGEWVEVPAQRFTFVFYLALGMILFLADLAGRIRNSLAFGLLIVPPIIVFSVVASWRIGRWLWPSRPSPGPPGVDDV
jgi:hypothetical protein